MQINNLIIHCNDGLSIWTRHKRSNFKADVRPRLSHHLLKIRAHASYNILHIYFLSPYANHNNCALHCKTPCPCLIIGVIINYAQ